MKGTNVSKVRQGDLSFGADEIERDAARSSVTRIAAPTSVRQLPPVQNAFPGQVGPAPATSSGNIFRQHPKHRCSSTSSPTTGTKLVEQDRQFRGIEDSFLHACTPARRKRTRQAGVHTSGEKEGLLVTDITTSLLNPFIACCVGRRNDYAVQLPDGERYPFVTLIDSHSFPLFSSVIDALGWFSTIERAKVSCLPTLSPQRDIGSRPTPHNISFKKPEPTTAARVPDTIRDWCAAQDALSVIGRHVSLNQSGVGCCPFGWHHDDGVDTHPSFLVYQPSTPDIYCWYCHTWQQGGSLFDFIRLYYGFEAGELWRLLLAGFEF